MPIRLSSVQIDRSSICVSEKRPSLLRLPWVVLVNRLTGRLKAPVTGPVAAPSGAALMSIQQILLSCAPLALVSVRRPSVTSTIDVLRNQRTLPPCEPERASWPSRFILNLELFEFGSPA